MDIDSAKWKKYLIDGAGQLGLDISVHQASQMAAFGRELLDWNRRNNLTAITDPRQIAVKHFLDSLTGLVDIPSEARLLDIGCGGGFPGLPLKIMRPGQAMMLMDAVRKKISFVKHVIRMLQLPRIEAVHARAEILAEQMDFQAGFDVVTCRALADLETIRRLALPLLAPGGRLVIYKGPGEIGQGDPKPAEIFDSRKFDIICRQFRLPYTGDARRIYVVRRWAAID